MLFRSYSQGNATSVGITSDSFRTQATVVGLVSCPSTLPVSSQDTQYQVRWSLQTDSLDVPYLSFTGLKVLGLTSSPIGPGNSVELADDAFTLNLVLEKAATSVTGAIYGGNNTKLFDLPAAQPAQDVAGGKLYQVRVDPVGAQAVGGVNVLPAALEGYIVSWKATDSSVLSVVNRYTSELFVVNPSILSAMEDVKRRVMKARTTLFGFQDMLFDPVIILSALRRGRDMFNVASGLLTEFSMTNATSGIREFWLRYSEVSMLLDQSLAEGEKAFDFQGAQISLTVDKAAVYRELADNLKQQLDNDTKPFKANLIKKGVVAGDGNMDGAALSGNSISRLGLSIHPSSPQGRFWRPGHAGPIW